jgi:hypothetical protein
MVLIKPKGVPKHWSGLGQPVKVLEVGEIIELITEWHEFRK